MNTFGQIDEDLSSLYGKANDFHRAFLRYDNSVTNSYPSSSLDIYTRAASWKSSTDTLKLLAGSDDFHIRRLVAQNINTPMEALEQLAVDPDLDVRENVARHPFISRFIQEKLAVDKKYGIRASLAANPHIDFSVLEQLAESFLDGKGFSVGCNCLACNPNCSEEIFERLVAHYDHYVRATVAENWRTPRKYFHRLSRDEDAYVRRMIASRNDLPLDCLLRLANDKNLRVRETVASNECIPSDQLLKWAKKPGWYDRFWYDDIGRRFSSGLYYGVAKNPNTPVSVIEEMSKDEDWELRAKVAANPNVPLDILERLSQDESAVVRHNIAYNPNTPLSILEQLLKDDNHDYDVENAPDNYDFECRVSEAAARHVISMYERSCVLNECVCMAKDVNTSPELLAALANDEHAEVRSFVAGNPSTPQKALAKLAEDAEESVRLAANHENGKNKGDNTVNGESVLEAEFDRMLDEGAPVHIIAQSLGFAAVMNDLGMDDVKAVMAVYGLDAAQYRTDIEAGMGDACMELSEGEEKASGIKKKNQIK